MSLSLSLALSFEGFKEIDCRELIFGGKISIDRLDSAASRFPRLFFLSSAERDEEETTNKQKKN